MRVHPASMGFEKASGLEWVLTNGLGGYASSTVTGLNTRKYHGFLIAALPGLKRMACLQRFDDVVFAGGRKFELGCIEFGGGLVKSPGLPFLYEFRRSPGDVLFRYRVGGIGLEKRVGMPHGKNAVVFHYRLINDTNG
ncbi:MAG: glycogen debranching enzyme N-terminal domain-containing protein, partial [Candidatus Altiarchaeota archaeon]|nr:glycogen debranching enzyme N-terminal domain-containing protein [Candidatus Altiarchaeota archaeon]